MTPPAPTTMCTVEEAQQLTQQLLRSLTDSWHLLREAYTRQAWRVLGYQTWDDYCTEELSTKTFRLAPEWRQRVVAQLSSGVDAMSNRAIGSALGVHHSTVAADRQATGGNPPVAGAQNYAPDEIVDAEIVDDTPSRRLGADGKLRTVPTPQPKRRPLIDDCTKAADDILKAAQRLARLTTDDRFPRNAEQVAAMISSDLYRAIDTLQGVANQLPRA